MAMYNGCRACSDGQVGIASITITTPGAQLCLNAFPHIKPFWIRATSYLPEHHFLLDGFTLNIKLLHGSITIEARATSKVFTFSLGGKVVCNWIRPSKWPRRKLPRDWRKTVFIH